MRLTVGQRDRIRELLVEKEHAAPARAKAIRRELRQMDFYISKFSASRTAFSIRDFDQLLSNGTIRIIKNVGRRKTKLAFSLKCDVGVESPSRECLEPLLADGLDVVFVGTEPGTTSLCVGHYYANSGNSFYRDLRQTGWTDRIFLPEEDHALLSVGIGLTDVYQDTGALRKRLGQRKPRAICFNSKKALERFGRIPKGQPWEGERAGQYVCFKWKPIVWALHDSSPQNGGSDQRVRKQRHKKRIRELINLRKLLRPDQ